MKLSQYQKTETVRAFLAGGLLLSLLGVFRIYNSLETSVGCGSDDSYGVSSSNKSVLAMSLDGRTSATAPFATSSPCELEYSRLSNNRTYGITRQDLLRSHAHTGNPYRLQKAIRTLSQLQRPFVAVVAGGSISLGHGTFKEFRYGERLENWMNYMYPLQHDNKHQVINVAAHGADMCSMAKRLNILYSDLESNMPSTSTEPDLIVLEFAVNDYQGQDHLIEIDHKTSVFFDGFQELVLCAEVVIHSLLTKYTNAAILFMEVQTAILTRKSGTLLHMGVAQQYQIPVVSYAEVVFPQFYQLMRKLEDMDKFSYSFREEEWMNDGGIGLNVDEVVNASQYASAVLPYPHGCSPCLDQNIVSQFRQGGCKSMCTFVDRSQIIHDRKLKCSPKQGDIPQGRNECFVPFLAHDAIHPSAVGHAIISDLIIETLASAQLQLCRDGLVSEKDELPLTTFVASSFEELKIRGDFLWVHDVDRIFSRWDELKPVTTTSGFKRYADDSLKQRPGWISTNKEGGESITFPIDLPPSQCYTVYVAILKSYVGMGTMTVEVRDHGSKKDDNSSAKLTAQKKVDGLWKSPISVWSDVQITEDADQGCTGYCEVTITTDPMVDGRDGNKVKVLTVSACRCSSKKL